MRSLILSGIVKNYAGKDYASEVLTDETMRQLCQIGIHMEMLAAFLVVQQRG